MSTSEAAALVGVNAETVRRWIDAADKAGRPVATRDRDPVTMRPIPGRHRRPYVDEVERWRALRAGEWDEQGDQDAGGGPVGD